MAQPLLQDYITMLCHHYKYDYRVTIALLNKWLKLENKNITVN